MKNLYQKIADIQKVVKGLAKDKAAYGYDYVSGDKLIGIIRPEMDKLGLLLFPSIEKIDIVPTTYQAYDRKLERLVEKTENLTILDMTMTWVDVETGDTLPVKWKGVGQNGFDKGFGSALTYAERYYLLKTFHIATNADDVDAISAARDEALESAARMTGTTVAPSVACVEDKPATQPKQLKSLPEVSQFIAMLADEKSEAHAWAALAASGGTSKRGLPARDAFSRKFAVTPAHMDAFDAYVIAISAAHENAA